MDLTDISADLFSQPQKEINRIIDINQKLTKKISLSSPLSVF
jgi:hypothetical protein